VKPIHFALIAILLVAPVASSAQTSSAPISGPIDLRNQSPFQLPFLNFAPQDGAVLADRHERTTVSLDIANDLLIPRAAPNAVHVDTETQRLAYGLRRGIAPGLEADVEVPIEWRNGGILDKLIESYHRWTGLSKPAGDDILGRQNISAYHSDITVQDPAGNVLFHAGPAFGLGDVTLAVKQRLLDTGSFRAAVRAGVKLPTGNADSFIGSGAFDYGADLDLDYRSGRIGVDANIGGVRPGRPTRIGGLSYDNSIGHLMLAVEYRVDGRTEWVLQNEQAGRGITTGNGRADGVQSGIALAFRRQWGEHRSWYAAFTENGDIANYEAPWLAYNGPDVTVSFGVEMTR